MPILGKLGEPVVLLEKKTKGRKTYLTFGFYL
jgi:hypothetical protein